MNNNGQQAMIAVQEERARIGGVEVAKKTVIAATEEGVIAFQINTVEASGPCQPRPALPSYPVAALPASRPSPTVVSTEGSCVDCCCACDDGHEWHELKGKGCCCVLLLLLFYLVVGVIFLPFVIAFGICYCLCGGSD